MDQNTIFGEALNGFFRMGGAGVHARCRNDIHKRVRIEKKGVSLSSDSDSGAIIPAYLLL